MDNLNQSGQKVVESDDPNPITLLKNPEKFKDTFYELTSIASESLKTQQFQRAIKALNKCLDMMDLGKNILKDISKYWKVCLYGNLACAYQGTWKMPKCNKFCQKIQEQLERLLNEAECKQIYLNITKYLIKIKFQHCAILSQLSQHQKALVMCESTLPTLSKYIETILQYTQSLKANRSQKKSSETVHFSKHVCAFAQQILSNLIKCLREPIKLNFDKSSFYYWQKNPQNNQKQVQKKFVSGRSSDSCKRSILGVNKMVHWIDQFNIGTIMHMSEMTVMQFQQTLPIEEYLFKDKLYETVIHCSIAHFTIATEMRFIESNKERERLGAENENKEQSATVMTNIQVINKKYGYQEKSEMFKISELYHLRAINIMAQNIKTTVPYISHLIKSYDKHYIYKKQLEPVIAIAEQSLMSISQTNHISINKKDFGINGSNKIPSRVFQEENEGQHYFTNTNLAGLNMKSNSQNGQNSDRINVDSNIILGDLEDPHPFKEQILSKSKKQKNHSQIKKEREENLSDSEQGMAPNYITQENNQNKLAKSHNKYKSTTKNKLKTVTSQKSLKKDLVKKKEHKDPPKDKKKKPHKETEQQFKVKHQSYTQIKITYKKKK